MTKKFWKRVLFCIAVLRVIAPFSIFNFPVFAALFNSFALDDPDGLVYYKSGGNYKGYLFYDKILDLYWYFFIVLFFMPTPAYYLVLAFFVYRFLGQIIVWLTKNTKLYIIFPGLIEVYFYIYLAYTKFLFPLRNFFDMTEHVKILVLTFLITIIREYIIHITRVKIGKIFLLESPGWKE